MKSLTQQQADQLLSYDPVTGILTWKVTRGSAKAGHQAGIMYGRYRRVGVDGELYSAHRLAWLISYGQWPSCEIDHINGVRDDNRLENLRDVTQSENSRNRPLRSDNSHGVPGVYFNSVKKTWYAQSCHGGKNTHLGSFASFDAAVAARRQFQEMNGYHPNHGRAA